MCRKILAFGMAAVISLSLAQCSNLSPTNAGASGAGNESTSFANLDEDVLIDLPSSVAKAPSGMSKRAGATDATPMEAIAIYDGIRQWIGLADELVNNDDFGVRSMILFWRDTLNWEYIHEVGSLSGIEGSYKWIASYDESRSLGYELQIKALAETGEPVVLEIDFNGDFENPAGRVYYHVGLLDPTVGNDVELLVEFNKTSQTRDLDISITSSTPPSGNDDFQNGILSLREKNGIVHLSGSSYHPGIDSVLPNTVGHCYTFTGTVDTATNQAIVNLGLPPADYTGTDSLFTTYGLSRMFSQAILLQEIPKLDDSLKMIVVTSYEESMTVEEILDSIVAGGSAEFLHDASEIEQMTVEQFTAFLELNQSISDPQARADISALLWIAMLEQPVYFNAIGYAGNGSTVPASFDALASIDCLLAPFAPSSVRDLSITR